MNNFFVFLVFFHISINSLAKEALSIKWYGTTCLTITDGKTILLFDPFVTRPSLLDLATFRKVQSDLNIVKKWLGNDLKKTKAIFVSHTHYDHVLDLVNAAKMSDSILYGSLSMKNVALGGGVAKNRVKRVKLNEEIQIGDFNIRILKAFHPPHFMGLTFFDGKINTPLPVNSRAKDYKMDQSYNYFIHHPLGKILLHPTPVPFADLNVNRNYDSDIVLMGIASRKSDDEILNKIILPMKPSIFIPLHYDNFFIPLSKELKMLPFVKLDKLKLRLKGSLPSIMIPELNYGTSFNYSKENR
jgi:L-ascorbate metabolism protein UlaG (beta-lactamase superfamily)